MLPPALARAIFLVRVRVRAQRALEGAASLSLAGFGIASIAILAAKIDAISEGEARLALALGAAMPLLGALGGALRRISALGAARMLDRAHGTEGRIAAALELAAQPRTEWTDRAIADAEERAPALRPSRAAPLAPPRDLGPALGLCFATGVLASLEIPRRIEIAMARGITPVVLHDDDLDAYEERLREVLVGAEPTAELRAEASALNEVLEDLAERRIDRAETLRRLAEIEARLETRRPADASLLRDDLRAIGRELARAEVAEPLAQALAEDDLGGAERAMRELAERVRRDPPSARELERLREAMETAAREREDEAERAEREHTEESERLLQRRREAGASEEDQQRLLEQRRRELEQLRREHQERAEAQRRLDRLRREMEEAARELGGEEPEREEASEAMERAAEDLQRMAREQMTEQQMQELARQLQELRELVRRQREQRAGEGGEGEQPQAGSGQSPGGTGSGAPSRMDRFVLRARGEGGDAEGTPIGVAGAQGQGQAQGQGGGQAQGEGEAQAQGEGEAQAQGEGQAEGQSAQAGAGGAGGDPNGDAEGQDEQRMLMLGQAGSAQLEIPGLGGRSGEQGGAGGSEGEGATGDGGGHAPATLEDPTRLGAAPRTVQVQGEHQRGPTRSEVIRAASQRGFASRDYRDVYSEYSDHAEEVIERDEVPPGYRFYVRRYFQLIRPREEREGD